MGDVGLMGMHVPGMSWREMREAAVLAEELGYSCLTMGESWGEDALTSLAQLAAVTSRVRIGTSIVPVFARSPANLAMTALNMDRMTGGRFFLGLGTSGRLVIEDFHGEQFAKPLTRMREYIDIIRKAARGERLDHDGEFFHTKRFQLRFTPHRASLPIYIAALSPPSLRLTGELADGWLPIFLAPSRMTPAVVEAGAFATSPSRPRCRSTSPTTWRRPATASGRTSPSTSAAWACSITSTCTASASAPTPTACARRFRRASATGPRNWSLTRWWTP
jgi:alkanesulfonate monooxygenase SsuD/methylene tetrahydromethanopterin reductase-like flavin-dependent oxidoreductase (luciferase family)